MKRLVQVFIIVMALLLGDPAAGAQEAAPNIILILADDLGYGDLGAYGATLIRTPRIDRMAAEGARLTDFHASGNVCTPSRAGLLTGRYAIRERLADGTVTINDTRGFPAGTVTIAGLLQQRGYRTALIGKWHLGHHSEAQRPNANGFDFFYGLLHPNDVEQPLYRNQRPSTEPLLQNALTRRFTEESVRLIRQSAGQSFFLLLAHTAPHIPLAASPAFAGSSQAGTYGDVVQELDWSVGKLLDAVDQEGIADNTLIMFTSDNGPFPEGSPGGLRGGKGTSWEGGYRVPFIARWPGRIKPGQAAGALAMNIDLFPTLAAAAGVPPPAGLVLDGRNILSILTGGTEQTPHEALYFFNHDRIAAVRTQNWRMVARTDYRNIERLLPDHGVQLLFDMRRDPAERYSLAAQRPEQWSKMQSLLERGQRQLRAAEQDPLP